MKQPFHELKLETNSVGDCMAKITCDYEDFEITIPKNITILDAR